MGFFLEGLNNELETAMVNEPSGFEPLKFLYIVFRFHMWISIWYLRSVVPYASPGYPLLLFSMRWSAPIYDFMRIGRILLQRFRRDIAFLC